jgi:hypothetical protein
MAKMNKNACLNFLKLKIGGSLYEVYLHKPTITTTMADVTTHTHELKDLHLWFEFTFLIVFFLCNLHLWFFHHRNVKRPHTLKKTRYCCLQIIKPHEDKKTMCDGTIVLLPPNCKLIHMHKQKKQMLGLSCLLPSHKIMEREDKIEIQDMGSKFNIC